MQAGQLKNKVEVYGLVTRTSSLNAESRRPELIRKIWANVVPISGQNREEPGKVSEIYVSHKVTVRYKSLRDIKPDYYLMYKGQKYIISYWYPNYKDSNYMELFCRLEVTA